MQAKLVQITRARFRNNSNECSDKGHQYSLSYVIRVTSPYMAVAQGSSKGHPVLNFRQKVPKNP